MGGDGKSPGGALRVLFAGDVSGRLDALFRRAGAATAKVGAFDLMLCVGQHGASDVGSFADFVASDDAAPVPTYVLGECGAALAASIGVEDVNWGRSDEGQRMALGGAGANEKPLARTPPPGPRRRASREQPATDYVMQLRT